MRKQMAKILTAVLLLGTLTDVSTAKAAAPKLNKSKLTLYIGSNYTLKVKKASGKVKWTSGKKSVATVSSKGKVSCKKQGKAKITAKIGSKKLICRLTVKTDHLEKEQRQVQSPLITTIPLPSMRKAKKSEKFPCS